MKHLIICSYFLLISCCLTAQIKNEYIRLGFDLSYFKKDRWQKLDDVTVKMSELSKVKYKFSIIDSSTSEIEIDSFPNVLNEYERSLLFFRVKKKASLMDTKYVQLCDFERPLKNKVSVTKGKKTLKPGQSYTMPRSISTLYFANLPPGEYWVEARYKKPLPDGAGYYLQVSSNEIHFTVVK